MEERGLRKFPKQENPPVSASSEEDGEENPW
jgi:hypothetical protein